MAKQLRLEDYSSSPESEDQSEQSEDEKMMEVKNDSSMLFEKHGNNYVVCDEIPFDTKSEEFRQYLSKFANVSEIIQGNFIETIAKLVDSQNENIRSYALVLLLNVAQNGGIEIENEVKSAIGNLKFMELIGDSDQTLNEQVLQIVMKQSNDEQLKQIHKILNKLHRYNHADENQKKEILTDELIPTILILFNQANEQLIQLQLNNKTISSLTIGTINYCCFSLIQMISNNSQTAIEIIKAGFITQFEKFFEHLPLLQAKTIHFNLLEILVKLASVKNHQFLFQTGVFQSICRFISHTSLTIIESILITLYKIVQSGLIYASSNSNSEIQFPINQLHPYFNILKNDGTLDNLENIIISNKINANISEIIIKTLILLYRGHPMPSSLLNIALNLLNNQLRNGLIQNKVNIQSLQYITINSQNHEVILSSNIIQSLVSKIYNFSSQAKMEILIALRLIYVKGNINTQNLIKQLAPLEKIESLINRQNLTHLIYMYNRNNNALKYSNAMQDNNLNKQIFALMVWYQNEKQMDKIFNYKNDIEELLGKDYMIDKIKQNLIEKEMENEKIEINNWGYENQNDKEFILNDQNKKNIWKYVQIMITTAEEIKDKELFQGAMILVRESLYMILFEQIKQWNQQALIESIDNLQIILNNSNDDLYFNLIDQSICSELKFIIDESKQEQQLSIFEKSVSLSASIAYHGKQMSGNNENNRFSDFFISSKLQYTLEQIVKKELAFNKNKLENCLNQIIFSAAIGISCIDIYWPFNPFTFNKCIELFQLILITFNMQIQQQSVANHSIKNNFIKINNINNNFDIAAVRKVIVSLNCLSSNQNVAQIMINQFKMLDLILPLIHLNCNCYQCRYNPNLNLISDLVADTFCTLQRFIYVMIPSQVDELNTRHSIFAHIAPIFHTISDNNSISKISSSSSSLQSNEYLQNTHKSFLQLNSALILLYSLMIKSKSITHLAFAEPNLVMKLMQITKNNKLDDMIIKQSNKSVQYNSLKLIKILNKFGNLKQIDWMIYNLKELDLIQNQMSSVGGCSNNDDDNILSADIKILITLFENLYHKRNIQIVNIISNEIKDEIEEDGLIEESNALIFHTDNRNVGVQTKAIELNTKINL